MFHDVFPGDGRDTSGRIHVLVVDAHLLIAEALSGELNRQPDLRVVATATDEAEALDLVSQHRPEVLLIDVSLEARAAFQLLKSLRAMDRAPRVVLLDDRVYLAHVREGLRQGALAYHTKAESCQSIARAIRRAAAGETSFCDELAERIAMTVDGPRLASHFRYTPLETLTQRELDVLLLIVQGATVKDCAEQLKLSASTVDNHKTRLMHKLNMHRTVDLVRMAIRERLIPT
jgi:two-component system nitrate/nitrite response regulator NarL